MSSRNSFSSLRKVQKVTPFCSIFHHCATRLLGRDTGGDSVKLAPLSKYVQTVLPSGKQRFPLYPILMYLRQFEYHLKPETYLNITLCGDPGNNLLHFFVPSWLCTIASKVKSLEFLTPTTLGPVYHRQ